MRAVVDVLQGVYRRVVVQSLVVDELFGGVHVVVWSIAVFSEKKHPK